MRFFSSALLVLTALVSTNGGRVQLKRGLSTYSATTSSPAYAAIGSGQPSYTKAFRPAPELKSASAGQQYLSQPAAYSSPSAQQYYQPEAQAAVAYSQPAVSKYAVPVSQKYSVASQANPQQYSSAADVSSFSYSSPVVSYNNLGFLHQIIGKGAGGQQQQQQAAYTAAAAPSKVQYASSPSQYSAAQSNYDIPNTYQAVAQKAAYSQAPQSQYQSQAYIQAQAQVDAEVLAQRAQAQALAEAQAQAKAQSQQQSQGQAFTFQATSPVSQKFSYSAIPSYQGLQKASPQVSYATAPQQVAYSSPQASSQAYESEAQSAPQIFYSQQPAAQSQYYSSPQSAKYARAGAPYAQ